MPLSSELDLRTPSGRLQAQRFGAADAPLGLCVPGLSANLRAFDFLGERLAGADRQVVAVDLRGRGRSSVTGPATYGCENHARDAPAVAGALGAESFSVIGQSTGGLRGDANGRCRPVGGGAPGPGPQPRHRPAVERVLGALVRCELGPVGGVPTRPPRSR
jgi:hypothetical protein